MLKYKYSAPGTAEVGLDTPASPRVVLGSASPRRRELLARLLETFTVHPSAVEETLGPGPLIESVTALAVAKARAVAALEPGALVLGADTVVALDGEVFGKPADPADAAAMLRRLRGRWHQVVTGVALVGRGSESATAVVSRVLVSRVDDHAIERYVASGEPLDKAGAYAIQGHGGALIAALVGSYTNVIGLPLDATRRLLMAAGVPVRPAGRFDAR